MPSEQTPSLILIVVPLLLGAVGALLAIFLKEAAQVAIQRRALAWQLFGYILVWKKQIVRQPSLFALYLKVQQREGDLRASFSGGTAAFSKTVEEQTAARDSVRNELKEAIAKALDAKCDRENTILDSVPVLQVAIVATAIAQQRRDLLDGKTFITDKDAALLGRSFAFNVTQVRASLQAILLSFEALPTILQAPLAQQGEAMTVVVDQLVLNGEDFLESLIRLERAVEQTSQKALWRLTWEVLTAH